MAEPRHPSMQPGEWTDAELELLLLYVDGELHDEPARMHQAEALLAASADARAIVDDWTLAKASLCEAIVEAPVHADLSMVRGRVMSRLPADPRPVVVDAPETGLRAWLRSFGLGKIAFAAGFAGAVAVALLVTSTQAPTRPEPAAGGGAVATARRPADTGEDAEPSVIIEDMEIESGTVMVRSAEHEGEATIIWHFQADEGAG